MQKNIFAHIDPGGAPVDFAFIQAKARVFHRSRFTDGYKSPNADESVADS
jgi:hypothetical protein